MERRLVEAAQRGDQEAFSEIAFLISPRLFAIAQRILRDFHGAEDAMQQALVQIWRKLPGLADPERFEAWAYRVLVNACYGQARRERRTPTLVAVDADDAVAVDDVAGIAERDMLDRAFRRMPPEQRAVLVLTYYLGLGHGEIAEVLGIPLGTVKSRASNGRQAMRAVLEADLREGLGWESA